MKVLAIDYMDIVNQGLEERFKGKQPAEERLRCDSPYKPAEVVFRRYWVDPDSELATECMLRGIGTIVNIGTIS